MTSVSRFLKYLGAALLPALLFSTDAGAFCINSCAYPKTVWEYFNHQTRHYVLLSDPDEIANVERGGAGAGWVATGNIFHAQSESFSTASRNVCRFYAPPPVNSHFFTANAAECEQLKNSNSGWIYEKLDFGMTLPFRGVCEAGFTPIYRVYNNRWMFSDSNHRFVHDAALRDELVARGWIDEGVAFCTEFAARIDRKNFHIATDKVRPSAECENEAINLGSCIALNQIPPLPNRITAWLPPSFVRMDPLFSLRYSELTRFQGNVYTAQRVEDVNAVAAHSFAQAYFGDSTTFGMHVSYLDRTHGELASINPLYQFRTTAPAANMPDERFMPWLYPLENELSVSFNLDVATVRRLNTDSHAYGHPTLQFMDTTSGQHLYVTIGAFGTGISGRPGDFLGVDGTTGRVIVGTAFRADPQFGKRIAGDFMSCDAGDCVPGQRHFEFRITKADFAKVLGIARTLDPRLSPTPANYLMANFHFNSEIYREAELGLSLSGYEVRVFGY